MNTSSPVATPQRSLRQCLCDMAALLYREGHVLETVSIPDRGLDARALQHLEAADGDWPRYRRILEGSGAATCNDQQRLVLTDLGRELLFSMFGAGAADSCA
ncbi:hypothetical protein [Halomonas maura]|uniref:hypothetical protein n=1 Tax=Halomonas maura TaxID=117606 RepID=UPI0025B57C61|nr:hypothetical protein [Halomonas maura]MDN3556230.1 hypothetical protein [Halomonas maura]